MKTPAFPLSILPRPSRLLTIAVTVAVSTAIILITVGPKAGALGLDPLPAIHPHLPRLGLIGQAPLQIQLHLAAVMIALAIGVVLLIGVKGTTLHRTLGWIWVVAMFTGAVSSLFIRVINHGSISFIHLFAGWTIVALPMAVAYARRHKVASHARAMTGLFTGGLVVAGLFAFIPGRLMWNLVF